MTFSFVGERGNANIKTVGTTLALTVANSNIDAGALVIVRAATDNTSASAGASTTHSVSDSQSNSYTRLVEYTQTGGAANDGVTVSLHYSVLTTGLTSGIDTITLTSNSVVVRAVGAEEFSTAGVDGTNSDSNGGTGPNPSVALSGLDSKTYLFIGQIGKEGPTADSFTEDTDYTGFSTHVGTNDGGPTGNISIHGGYRITSGTGDTYNPALGTGRDYAAAIAALYEAAAGGLSIPVAEHHYIHHVFG